MKNHYQILGIQPTATRNEIKAAYLKLSKKVHPDLNSGDEFFTELFKNVNEAYQLLSDDVKRKAYDLQLKYYNTDYKHLIEKEAALHRKEAVYHHLQTRRKLLWRGTVSLLSGLAVIAVFSMSFDKRNDFATTAHSQKHHEVFSDLQTDTLNNVSPVAPVAPVSSPAVEMKKIHDSREEISILPEVKKLPATKQQASAKRPTIQNNTTPSKELGEAEMTDVLNYINAQKNKLNDHSKCVKIIRSSASNVSNAFDLAGFLQSEGFIIAGRENIQKTVYGIQVDHTTGCTLVTVGIIN